MLGWFSIIREGDKRFVHSRFCNIGKKAFVDKYEMMYIVYEGIEYFQI